MLCVVPVVVSGHGVEVVRVEGMRVDSMRVLRLVVMWGTVFVQVERERVEVVRNTGLVEQMIVEVVMVAGMVRVS